MTPQGFVKLPRQVYDSPLWPAGRHSHLEAYCDLLRRGVFHPSHVRIGDKRVWLETGEFLVTVPTLAKAWEWPQTTVKKFLASLLVSGFISRRRSGNVSILKCLAQPAIPPQDGLLEHSPEVPSEAAVVPPQVGPGTAAGTHSKNNSKSILKRDSSNILLECGPESVSAYLERVGGEPGAALDPEFAAFVARQMQAGRQLRFDAGLMDRLRAEWEASRQGGG